MKVTLSKDEELKEGTDDTYPHLECFEGYPSV
jgi:hypothetical protein